MKCTREEERVGEEKKKLKKRMIMCVQKTGYGGLFEKSVSMKERIKT